VTPAIGPDLAHATDEQVRAALEEAELPSLMPALAYLTGDLALVGRDLRPQAGGPSVVLAAQGGMSTAQQALARQRAPHPGHYRFTTAEGAGGRRTSARG